MARTITTTQRPARVARRNARSTISRPARRKAPRSRARTSRRVPSRAKRPASRNAPHQRDVQAFLDRFTSCLTGGDGDGAMACFELPAMMIMADPKYGPSQVLQEPDKVSGFFAQAPDMYHEKGIETTLAEIEDLRWLDDGLGLVAARFPYVDADGNDMGDGERSLYVIRRDGNGELAICTAIALGTDSDRAARGRRRPIGNVGDQVA